MNACMYVCMYVGACKHTATRFPAVRVWMWGTWLEGCCVFRFVAAAKRCRAHIIKLDFGIVRCSPSAMHDGLGWASPNSSFEHNMMKILYGPLQPFHNRRIWQSLVLTTAHNYNVTTSETRHFDASNRIQP